MLRNSRIARLLAVVLGLALGTFSAQAQEAPGDSAERVKREKKTRVAVTIAVVDSMPLVSDAGVAVIRRASLLPRDVIVVHRNFADGEQLSAAVFTLLGSRALSGDTATADQVLTVTHRRGPVAWRKHEVPALDRLLERIAGAPKVPVAGVGPARTAEVYLPPKMLKDKLRPAR